MLRCAPDSCSFVLLPFDSAITLAFVLRCSFSTLQVCTFDLRVLRVLVLLVMSCSLFWLCLVRSSDYVLFVLLVMSCSFFWLYHVRSFDYALFVPTYISCSFVRLCLVRSSDYILFVLLIMSCSFF